MEVKILLDPKARDFLKKIDNKNSQRIIKKLKEMQKNPTRYMFTLVNRDNFKIRIGDYRLFTDYYEKEKKLIIRSIRHRKNAYKKD